MKKAARLFTITARCVMIYGLTVGTLSAANELTVFDIKLGGLLLDGVTERVVLSSDDLKESLIEIFGKASVGTRRVLYSINNGASWNIAVGAGEEFGAGYWSFHFEPRQRSEYTVLIKAYDHLGNASKPVRLLLYYDGRTQKKIIEEFIADLELRYNSKDFDGFMKLIAQDQFQNVSLFEEQLKDMYGNTGRLELHMRIREISAYQDTAMVRVNWSMLWEDESSAEGWGVMLELVRKPNWLLANTSSMSIFLKGTGKVSVRLISS